MSAAVESPPDETSGVNEIVKNDKEEDVQENSDVDTEPAMLDEEEMPSYVSLTSLSKLDESKAEQIIMQQAVQPARTEDMEQNDDRASSPYPSEHGADSVCVLSSEEMMEDYDSEDMDMEDEEDEEEDDDEGDSCNDDDEDSDGDIEPEQFERSSDDFVLRYDSGLEKHQIERSRSLQDLTNSRGNLSRFVGKRRSINISGSYEQPLTRHFQQESLEDPLLIRRKPPRSIKYDHVPSKVKLYIEEMKKQRRRSSAERLNQRAENSQERKLSNLNSRDDDAEIVTLDSNAKVIKRYAQNVIDELARNNENSEMHYPDPLAISEEAQLMSMNTITEVKELEENEKNISLNPTPQNLVSSERSGKSIRMNGVTDHGENDIETEVIPETNGQEQMVTIMNIGTVSYEEFANGEKSSKMAIEDLSCPKVHENNENPQYIEKVKSMEGIISDERVSQQTSNDTQLSGWNLRALTLDEPVKRRGSQVDGEVHQKILNENNTLKRELEELKKSIEQNRMDDGLKQAYQNALLENTSLKEELQQVKKKFEEYRKMNVRPKMVAASVQTESMEEQKMDTPTDHSEQASTFTGYSFNDKFSESTCNVEISTMPSMETVPTDDSAAVDDRSNPQNINPMSLSFVTSSRILQTLANITQNRPKSSEERSAEEAKNVHANIEQGQSKRQAFDPVLTGNDANTSRAKKRKISDMLASATDSGTFKIPHTHGETRRKVSSNSAADVWFETNDEGVAATVKRIEKKLDEGGDQKSDNLEDEADDSSKNVKYFVYHEDPNKKERSFLIQAQDPITNGGTSEKTGNGRECGPFLLGNVEIRMCETNGTINIWGKEVEDLTEGNTEFEAQDSGRHDSAPFAPRSSFTCQSTPYQKNHVNLSSCSSKKRASPKLSRSGIAKYLRSATANFTKHNDHDNEHDYEAISPFLDHEHSHCQHCASHRKLRSRVPSCEHLAHDTRVIRSCCVHSTQISNKDCDDENEVFEDSTMYDTISNIVTNQDKCRHTPCNSTSKEEDICRNITSSCNRVSRNEQDFHQTNKRTSSCNCDVPSCSMRVEPRRRSCHENHSSSRSPADSCDDERHRLLSSDSNSEAPETKRRRLSGKKMRGILTDLLRGCGGCKDPHASTSSLPRANLQNAAPQIVITPCSPNPVPSSNKASCSKQATFCPTQSNHTCNQATSESCCEVCLHRQEMRASFENQLKILQGDMEHVQMRSRAMLAMLQKLN